MFRELIERGKDDMYVDDLVTGGESTSEVDKIKGDSVNLFQRRGFKLQSATQMNRPYGPRTQLMKTS